LIGVYRRGINIIENEYSMENKVSEYNIEVDYCNGVLLYNTLTNKLLPVSFEDYTVIETLMEHLPEFEVKFTRFTHYMYRMKTTSNKLITNIL
jgi:hypothetical protein